MGNLAEIQGLLEEGQHLEARKLLKEYLKEKPDSSVALRMLGNTYAYTGFLGRARKIWRAAIKRFPEDVDLLYNFALAHYLVGDNYVATKYWRRALKKSPKDAEIYFNLGQIARDEGDLLLAVKRWKKAHELSPENVEIMNNIGVVYASIKRYKKAIAWYDKALETDEDYALAHFNLANAHIATGNSAEASKHAELAAKLDPATHLEQVTVLQRQYFQKNNRQE
jgi:tetratricopeptide (TPR) repeat protein